MMSTTDTPDVQIIIKEQLSDHSHILVAPLNWGLGHTVRCIPLIEACLKEGKTVFIASDGLALTFLQKEFPKLTSFQLPPYGITYPFRSIVGNLIYHSPGIIKAVLNEHKEVKKIVESENITAIISDNRWGAFHKNTLNIIMTHQMNLVHKYSWMARAGTIIHRNLMRGFDKIWIPDHKGEKALAPDLSHTNSAKATYLGPLMTLKAQNSAKETDLAVILSGPEPRRTVLENQLLNILSEFCHLKIIFVRGTDQNIHSLSVSDHIQVLNLATRDQIAHIIASSRILVARSGYTTVMDTWHSDIFRIWIPTEGQTEQEYLAKRLAQLPDNAAIFPNKINKLKNIITSLTK